MKIAIVALTRGYPENINLYKTLITRNEAIFKKINQFRDVPADLILFHEGNISKNDQKFINSKLSNKIIFKDVSKYFKVPELVLEEEEKFNLGYRLMCRFNMLHLWDEVSEYDYILRVDEDIEITKFNPNIFEYMEEKNIVYMTGRFSKEIHGNTNKTLPYFLIEKTDMNVDKIYNHKFPYTNLYISKVDFWKQDSVYQLLKLIALSNYQLIYRWGDIPVLGGILNFKNEKINLFPHLEYKHISHDLVIKNNFLRNLTINSKYNPISIKEGVLTKTILKIKGLISSKNKYDFRVH